MKNDQKTHNALKQLLLTPDQGMIKRIEELSCCSEVEVKEVIARLGEDNGVRPITKFVFGGESYSVLGWQDMLVKLCEILHKKHPENFPKAYELNNKELRYFSHSPNDLYTPRIIHPAKVYIETAISDSKTEELSRRLIELFGYQNNDLQFH